MSTVFRHVRFTQKEQIHIHMVHTGVRRHVVALGDNSGAFYQAPLKEERIFLEPPPEAQVPLDSVWETLCAFPGPKGAPKAWEEHSAQEMEKLGTTRGRYDGCMFQRWSDQSKAGGIGFFVEYFPHRIDTFFFPSHCDFLHAHRQE